MRRVDREVKDLDEIKRILLKADVLRVAMNNGKYPYILPVNFGFEMKENNLILFFHGSKDGAKHEIIKNDCHVSFEVDCDLMLIPPLAKESCTSSFAYESVIGQGIIEKAEDIEKERLLVEILNHYKIKMNVFNSNHFANTVIYKIIVNNYTAKKRAMDC